MPLHINTLLLISIFLAACATAPIKKDALHKSVAFSLSESLSKPFPSWSHQQLFPDRTDLPHGDSYTRKSPFRPVSPISQPPPQVVSSVAPGTYELYLFFIIENDGTVQQAKIVDGAASDEVNQACLAMIRSWRFSPTISGGLPIAVGAILPVHIVIKNEG